MLKPLKPTSVILGLLFLVGGTVGCFMLAGNDPRTLLYFVPALAMLLLPVGCSIIGFGIRGPMIVLRSLTGAIRGSEPAQTPDASRAISAFIGYVYGAGGFVFFASLVTTANFFPHYAVTGFKNFNEHIAAVLVPLIYTVVLAELMLRPLKHRLA